MSTFGTHVKISLFGESHGDVVGITIHHLPAGFSLDLRQIENALSKRRPSKSFTTARQEKDNFTFISGVRDGLTTGAPLTIIIENKSMNSADYDRDLPRPSHADYAAHVKYRGANDPRGGGHFSGRLTAPLVVLGEIAAQLLATQNIVVVSHIASIHHQKDRSFYDVELTEDIVKNLLNSSFPLIDSSLQSPFEDYLESIYLSGDSVGGTIETMILNLPTGIGEPFFDGIDSILAHLIYSIPAVKGLSFGRGFELSRMKGSESNDPLVFENTALKFLKNDMGGLTGGLSTSQPLVFTTAIKPTPTIRLPQQTVNLKTKENITHTFKGRHDTCIVPRVLPVINALTSYGMLELLVRNGGFSWLTSEK